MSESKVKNAVSGIAEQLPMDRLKHEAQNFGQALAERGATRMSERVENLTGRLNDIAEGGGKAGMAKRLVEGDSPAKAGLLSAATKVKDKVKDAVKGKLGSGGKGTKLKVTNILESIDVPVNREVAYRQWTQFEDFPSFTKKVENVTQEADERVKWQAQIFWSHRTWNAKIVDQVPNERIVWKSEGRKGHVDGAVTFHEVTPDLTRILLVLEYHPKGLFEHTGNLWRAQGRRARLELKHFARHVSTQTILHQDDVKGWSGEIHDSKVQRQMSDADNERDQQQSQDDERADAKSQRSGQGARESSAKGGSDKGASDTGTGSQGGRPQSKGRPQGSARPGTPTQRGQGKPQGTGARRPQGRTAEGARPRTTRDD